MGYIQRQLDGLRDLKILLGRNKRSGVTNPDEEALTEQEFVRSFGTKVKAVRLSNRLDMVGLILLGSNTGIWITRGAKDGLRRVRAVDVVDGKVHPTARYLLLRHKDSLSNLRQGLLRWIQ